LNSVKARWDASKAELVPETDVQNDPHAKLAFLPKAKLSHSRQMTMILLNWSNIHIWRRE